MIPSQKTGTTALVGASLLFLVAQAHGACSLEENGFACDNGGSGGTANVGVPLSAPNDATLQSAGIALASDPLEEQGEVIRETGESAGPGGGVIGMFATGLRVDKDYDSSPSGLPGIDSDVWGGQVGVDFTKDRYTLGVALEYSREKALFKEDLGRQDSDTSGVQLFGIFKPQVNSFLALAFRYGSVDIDSTRRTGPTLTDTAAGSTDGTRYGLTLGGGYAWPILTRTSLTLSGWLDWRRNEINGYTETGTFTPNERPTFLTFADDDYSTSDGIIQLDFVHAIPTQGSDWYPFLDLAYVHEFESDTRNINAVVPDQPADIISIRTNEADANYFRWGLGINGDFRQGTTLYARYRGTAGHDWRSEGLFLVGIRQAF